MRCSSHKNEIEAGNTRGGSDSTSEVMLCAPLFFGTTQHLPTYLLYVFNDGMAVLLLRQQSI